MYERLIKIQNLNTWTGCLLFAHASVTLFFTVNVLLFISDINLSEEVCLLSFILQVRLIRPFEFW